MSARINILVRAVASVTGDITIGYAMASACIWVIQAAALGLFLSFLLWLLTIIASLAFSQHALHPAVALLLSDRKLDRGLAVGSDALRVGTDAARQLWSWAQMRSRTA